MVLFWKFSLLPLLCASLYLMLYYNLLTFSVLVWRWKALCPVDPILMCAQVLCQLLKHTDTHTQYHKDTDAHTDTHTQIHTISNTHHITWNINTDTDTPNLKHTHTHIQWDTHTHAHIYFQNFVNSNNFWHTCWLLLLKKEKKRETL